MRFEEALDWLNDAQFTGIKLGLENTIRLLEAVGNPQERLRFIHVAGTNGKGSVCAMLDSCLRAAGHKTGLYTSPHLVDFRERIRVDGVMISTADAARGLTLLREASIVWEHNPTFFELATVLAMDHFARSGCDIVVLETGMGGRLDSTNAMTPLVSVITPIAMDHMNWLGDTLSKIAAEKAGIIKPGVPVVSAPQQAAAAQVLQAKARETGSVLRLVDKATDFSVSLPGSHQLWNAALAIATLEVSGLNCPPAAIQKGLLSVKWPARFQRVGERFVIDGAHNEHSAEALVATWIEVFENQKASIVFGALRDKEYANMLRLLEKIGHQKYFVTDQSERSEDPAHFKKSTNLPATAFDDLPGAIKAASEASSPVLITGSLFLAGEALTILETLNSQAEG
ncbi:MAG: bifunctional folylpolyglutamate synthase/dihydrofolate synthase [Spartobacteria bacterium]